LTERPYETVRIADIEDANGWSPIRLRLGVQSFGVNAWTAHVPHTPVIPEHDEKPSGHEELYLVTAGRATFTVAGEDVDATAGTIVFVRDPAARRGAVAREADTTVVTVGGEPGHAFRPRAWETNSEVFALLDRGEHAEAKRVLTAALERYEDRAALFYNLACAEAQLGETDAALEHLRTALSERADWVDSAREDADLAPIRDDPRFAETLGGG
jgi:tetratricopeptide (TPR) repeat protein